MKGILLLDVFILSLRCYQYKKLKGRYEKNRYAKYVIERVHKSYKFNFFFLNQSQNRTNMYSHNEKLIILHQSRENDFT